MNRGSFKGALSLVSRNFLAQAVLAVSAVPIAYFAAPSTFGVFAAIAAINIVAGAAISLRLELAIAIPSDEAEAKGILRFTALSSVVNALLVYATIAILLQFEFPVLPSETSPLSLVLAGTSLVLIGVFNGLNQMVVRQKKYKTVGNRALIQAFVTACAQATMLAFVSSPESLLAGQVLGQTVAVALLARHTNWTGYVGSLKLIASRYRMFPLVSAPSALVNALGLQAPLIVGAALWGASFAGWFGMTQRFLAVPVAVVGQAVAVVLIGEFGSRLRKNDPNILSDFMRISKVLSGTAVVAAVTVLAIGPSAFEFMLGESYRESGAFARAMAIGLAGQIAAGSFSVLLPILGRQIWQALWDITRLVLSVLALWIASLFGYDAVVGLWILSGLSLLLYAVQWLMVRRALVERTSSFPVSDSQNLLPKRGDSA